MGRVGQQQDKVLSIIYTLVAALLNPTDGVRERTPTRGGAWVYIYIAQRVGVILVGRRTSKRLGARMRGTQFCPSPISRFPTTVFQF
jgi:hypothetical protein